MQIKYRDLCWPLAAISLLLMSHTKAYESSDGIEPHGHGNAPDVVSWGPSWNESYPASEGDEPNLGADRGLSSRADDFYLRVMPLGASITQGYLSTDNNGYRKWLRSQLRYKGWKVNMVGSKQNGDMTDRDNEGWPGYVIDQVHNEFRKSMWMKPNLVLINAGTNDCNQKIDINGAGGRMKALVDDIYSNIPGVTIVLSTIVRSTNVTNDACASKVSKQIRQLVKTYRSQRIGLADINPVLPTSMLQKDGIHPTDAGYKLFASVWWDAIRKIQADIQPPAKVSGIDDAVSEKSSECKKTAGNSRAPTQSQRGSGHDDGIYRHYSHAQGVLKSLRLENGGDSASLIKDYPWHVFFANIVLNSANSPRSHALDDMIRIHHEEDGTNTYWYRQNQGGGKFAASKRFDVDMDCNDGPRYAFADFNNDGLDDFFCLKSGSAVWVSINQGGNPPKFKSIGQVVGKHDGYEPTDVRITDIDGDGRADYCLVEDNGAVICSRNGGTGDKYAWQGFKTAKGLRDTVFDKNPKSASSKSGVVFADLNGDFRDEYMWVSDTGSVHTWNNMRGWGKGIVPEWRDAGLTHKGQAAKGIQNRIKFGRIYGSGRRDYIYLRSDKTGIDMVVWENKGFGGTKRKADGNFYCDMRGTGSDDYVWIYFDGHAAELNANIHNPPLWGNDLKIELKVPGPRVGIHLADWTGDGKCDVLVQNEATGALTLYENTYKTGSKSVTFTNKGVVTPATCSQGWGVSPFDRGMKLADIDGDGRADVICLEPNGRITGWLNLKSGMENVGQVKFPEGRERADIRFADVENSGRADIIYLDKYTGAATVFKNLGRKSGTGSSFNWSNRGVLYAPIDRGETMHFTNQGGLGRADLVHVLPFTNKAYTYFNECGASGGDDGPITDPGLPKYSTGGQDGGTDDGSEDGDGSGDDCSKPSFDGDSKVILSENFPDPSFVFDFESCTWYSFGSQDKGKLVQIAQYNKSKDTWELLNDDPLKDAGAWGQNLDIVAPDVQWNGKQWVMYYSAFTQDDHDGKRCIGVAFSDSIRGPYTPRDEPLVCQLDKGGVIDPSSFYDPGSDTRWVVYKIDGNRICGKTSIMLQQVENDGFTLKNDPVEILSETDDEKLLETPSLVYEDGSYLLFYSSGCYTSDKYSIKYATSGSISGPYDRGNDKVLGSIAGSIQSPGSASSNGNGHLLFAAWCDKDLTTRCLYSLSYKFEDGQVTLS
ncbi:uncharacterized protein FPRO_12749 [Fusarium proliferatum ET1]|uniref:Related to acetylxylan esterase n=1 Tax=Fusarium proliferatum (strain ET1) TaxID=1227346 RepID=A0A1L7W6A1_FUSPR|nr:uncharacterized protein FPRO_12749 [Fusarium proliferatum ET1]CZR48139.1 related to acetylxylan esterase [Fusarium proliferatum ET1]